MSFEALLEAALAGTSRQEPPAMLNGLAALPPDERLLRAAAYEGLRRLAGRPLERGGPADLPACPTETLPEAPRAAAARLRDVLAQRPDLLPEWCRLAHQRGLRAPHALLPDLLEQARAHPDLVDPVRQIGGERLAWLAELNPAWRFAVNLADPPASFDAGATPEERARGLRAIRRQDPARARDLLAASWDGESAEARVALLGTLEDGLSAEDEPLLERALRDSRKGVRREAVRLVRRIPGSAFAERWRERARAHVTLKRGLLGRRAEVREPKFESSWAADGAEQRPPQGTGQIAWWLQQLVALAPPDTWPDDALPTLLATDWANRFLFGLAESAEAYRHRGWTERLILAWAAARAKHPEWQSLDVAGLLAGLPSTTAEHIVRQALERDVGSGVKLVPALRHPWSEDFSRYFAQRLADLAERWAYAGVEPIAAAELCLDPAVLPGVERAQAAPQRLTWTARALERLARTLDYRQQMRKELAG